MCETVPLSYRYLEVGPRFHGYALALRSDGRCVVVDDRMREVALTPEEGCPSTPSQDAHHPARDEQQARADLVRIARLIYERDYNVTIDGNISVRLTDDTFLLTPTGRHKGFLQPEDLAVVDAEGNLLRGAGRPSAEYRLHTFIYRRRADVRAVIHVHSPYATAASLAGVDLWQTWITMAPVPTTEYARIASADSPRVIEPFVDDYNWAILPRHGAVTWADSLWNAFLRLEGLEHFAKVVMIARATGPIEPMSPERRAELLKLWNLEHLDQRP